MNGAGVPFNDAGYQQPQDGNAYCGLVAYDYIANCCDYREYIEVELNEPLTTNEEYSWQFYVCLAGNITNTVNKIGLALSDTLYVDYNPNGWTALEAILIPDVGYSIDIIEDSINWTKIEGKYTTHGGEKFLLIGVFYDSLNIDINSYTYNIFIGAYYYIDNVQLCKGECVTEINLPNVFTPNNDQINDVYVLNNQNIALSYVEIYNRWGNQVYFSETDVYWDGTFKNQPCSDGVYFIIIAYYDNNQLKTKQGTIQLIR